MAAEDYSLHIYHGIGHSPNVEVSESFAGLLARFVGEVDHSGAWASNAGASPLI